MTSKTFVEVNADGIVTHQVTRVADDWNTVQLPASWLEVASNLGSVIGYTRHPDGSLTPPLVVSAPPDQVAVALDAVLADLSDIKTAVNALPKGP